MTFGRFKSKKRALRLRSTAKGSRMVHSPRKPHGLHCASCNAALVGASSSRALPKSQKRVSRPFGSVLCAACVREAMKQKARSL